MVNIFFSHYRDLTVVKWVSIIWLFGKKNNASKKIWEFVAPETFRILFNEPSKLAQENAILCQPDTFVQFLSCALLCQPQKRSNVHFGSINVPNQRNPAQTCNFYCSPILKNYTFLQKNLFFHRNTGKNNDKEKLVNLKLCSKK